MGRSQGLEVGEGTASTNAEPFLPDPQLHRRLRESELQLLALVAQPPLGLRLPTVGAGQRTVHPGLARVDEPVPPVAHRRRGHPMPTCCLGHRHSPFNTANTTWICSSTDTCRDGFCCLLTRPSFPTLSTQPPAGKFDSLHPPPLERCPELLGVDLDAKQEAAAYVEPYLRVDGTKVWSVMQLVSRWRACIRSRGWPGWSARPRPPSTAHRAAGRRPEPMTCMVCAERADSASRPATDRSVRGQVGQPTAAPAAAGWRGQGGRSGYSTAARWPARGCPG
jgi:hypothetical protein